MGDTITANGKQYTVGDIYSAYKSGNLKLIGSGSEGDVYKYNDDIAIKIFKGEVWYGNDFQLLQKVYENCGGVPRVYGMFTVPKNNFLYFAWGVQQVLLTEYVNGFTLKKLMSAFKDDLIGTPNLRILFRYLLKVLECMHRHKIVHRDIKPRNIMVDCVSHKIKYIDFGLGCFLEDIDSSACQTKSGTDDYMAPEAFLRKKTADQLKSADVWSLGITFYKLYDPHFRPYKYGKNREALEYIMRHIPDRDPVIKYAIEHMLKWDGAERWTADQAYEYFKDHR